MKIESQQDSLTRDFLFFCRMTDRDVGTQQFANAMMYEIAKQLAERFVAENYQALAAAMDPKAIATIAVAEAGAAINKTLREKIPDRVLEVQTRGHDTVAVLQRGLFGGIRRIV